MARARAEQYYPSDSSSQHSGSASTSLIGRQEREGVKATLGAIRKRRPRGKPLTQVALVLRSSIHNRISRSEIMKHRISTPIGVPGRRLAAIVGSLAVVLGLCLASSLQLQAAAASPSPTRILIVAGPSQHPPGTHEVAATARLIEYLLEHAQGVPKISAQVVQQWPKGKAALDGLAAIVFTGDIFPAETLENPAEIKADLAKLTERGCGIVCVHYATGLRAQHVSPEGDHPLLRWTGGYFATGCTHHRSVARVVPATLAPEGTSHPVLRGWKTFSFYDEPYWNNYFGKDGPAENVTFLVSAMLPPEEPRKEIVAWAVQRDDGGRGLGIVVPHFIGNWKLDDLRTLMINSICWTAKLEIPAEGVQTALPDLSQFQPASVEIPAPPNSAASGKTVPK